MSNFEEKVLEYLKSTDEPKSLIDICESLGLTRSVVKLAVDNLVSNEEIVAVAASNRKYYIVNNEGITAEDYSRIKTKTLEMVVPVKAASDDAKEELENMRKDIKNMYSNIISIMAVFVAIFSIVFAGGNLLFQCVNAEWAWHTLIAFLATEAGIVIAVLIMLYGVKKFLNK
jgi:hypothetical protein